LEDLGALLSYEEWEAKQKRTAAQRKAAKLRSYGLLRALLSHMDAILGDGTPKVSSFARRSHLYTWLYHRLFILITIAYLNGANVGYCSLYIWRHKAHIPANDVYQDLLRISTL
ncbi:unnamed protein product, partial [Meganyctiphanes norvegica]